MHPLRRIIRTVLLLPIREAEERERHVQDIESKVQHAEKCFMVANSKFAETRADMGDLLDLTLRKTLGRD